MSELIRRAANRVLRTVARDPQTHTLLSTGARGIERAAPGLLTAWDWWVPSRKRDRGAAVIEAAPGYPRVSLESEDPIAAITTAPEFVELSDAFARVEQPERALVSAVTQALLYALVRNLRPDRVVEIGTYRASTSKAICRALHANGRGEIHTVDPFNSSPIMRLVRCWPRALRERFCFYPMSSMDFFEIAFFRGMTSDLVFVDGNHEYEYALFDIENAARLLRPGGFIVIDNISQAGPFLAAQDFLRDNPSWRECGHSLAADIAGKAFDLGRSTITHTDMCVLRAPSNPTIGRRPVTQRQQLVTQPEIGGVGLPIVHPASGTLYAQYVVRVREPVMSETTAETAITFDGAVGETRVPFPWVFPAAEIPLVRTVELWLTWTGDKELELSAPPSLY